MVLKTALQHTCALLTELHCTLYWVPLTLLSYAATELRLHCTILSKGAVPELICTLLSYTAPLLRYPPFYNLLQCRYAGLSGIQLVRYRTEKTCRYRNQSAGIRVPWPVPTGMLRSGKGRKWWMPENYGLGADAQLWRQSYTLGSELRRP